jgi:hypothetical protein
MAVTKKIRIFLAAAVGLAVSLLLIKVIVGSPILLRVPDFHSSRGRPLVLILNPFRNHDPERVAETFLHGLKNGQCVDLISSFSLEKVVEICEKQDRYPLVEWKLMDLDEENGTYSFAYEHKSKNAAGLEDMHVWVKQNGQGWKVADFVIAY